MTIDEIRSGTAFPDWDAAIERRLEQDSRERPDFPLFRDHDAFRLGAAAAAAGSSDSSDLVSSFRYGFDWANTFALEHSLWEAWHRAYLEVVERRPIGRSEPGGVRYYGSRDAIPPAPPHYPPVHVLLWKSLHLMQGSTMRWTIHRELGTPSDDFARAVSAEFSTCSSSTHGTCHGVGHGCKRYNPSGSQTPKFTYYNLADEQTFQDHHSIAGDKLIELCSTILDIGVPQLMMI